MSTSNERNDSPKRVEHSAPKSKGLGELALRQVIDQAGHVSSTYRLFGKTVDVVGIAQRIARQQGFPRLTEAEICAASNQLSAT